MRLISTWNKIAWPLVVKPSLLDWTRKDFDSNWVYYVRRIQVGDDNESSPRVFLLATDRHRNFQALYHVVATEELSGPNLIGRAHYRLQLQEVRTSVLREDLTKLVGGARLPRLPLLELPSWAPRMTCHADRVAIRSRPQDTHTARGSPSTRSLVSAALQRHSTSWEAAWVRTIPMPAVVLANSRRLPSCHPSIA